MSVLPAWTGYVIAGGLYAVVYLRPEWRRSRARARVRRICRAQGGPLPLLTQRVVPEPLAPPWCERAATRLEGLGFVRLGAFKTEGTTQTGVTLLHPEGFAAEAAIGGTWPRSIALYAVTLDGESFGVTDAAEPVPPSGTKAARPAWSHLRHLPRAKPSALIAALKEDLGRHTLLALTTQNYLDLRAKEERRMSEWLLVHGPLRPEMVPNLEAASGMKADPESLALLRTAHAAKGVYPHE